jgi:hypothetical protein
VEVNYNEVSAFDLERFDWEYYQSLFDKSDVCAGFKEYEIGVEASILGLKYHGKSTSSNSNLLCKTSQDVGLPTVIK